MSSYRQQVDTLLDQAADLEPCLAQVALLEQALNLADSHGDLEDAFDIRMRLVRSAVFAGVAHKGIVAYSWCLAQCDREPERFPEQQILWEYKWILNHAMALPAIPLAELQRMFDDMERRYQRNGDQMYGLYDMRRSFSMRMGFLDEARALHARLQHMPTDGYANCAACRQSAEVIAALYLQGDEAAALELAKPLLEGELYCSGEPEVSYGRLLEPLVRQGRMDEAKTLFAMGYKKLARQRKYLFIMGDYLRFAVLAGFLDQATAMLERHLAWAVESWDLEDCFEFYLAATYYFATLQEHGRASIALRLPGKICEALGAEIDSTAALRAWFHGQCVDIAGQFDQRNGNDFFGRRLDEVARLQALAAQWAASAQ